MTGLVWYCPREDWRYAFAEDALWLYCPGCAERVLHLDGPPINPGAPP